MARNDQLVSYLLGNLPDQEIERLDELSVTDESFAQRLRETEHDLVDAYVRGELAGDVRERIEAVFRSSERGRSRLQFAHALHALTRRRAEPAAPRRSEIVSRAIRSWALPVAATVVLGVASAVLLTSNVRLRRDVQRLAAERESLTAAGAELRQQLASRSPDVPPPLPPPALFLLRAPRRDAAGIPPVDVPRDTDRVVLNLQLEANDFASYYAAVARAADRQVVWRTGDLAATAGADGAIVPVTVPASILTAGRYTVALHGRSGRGVDEPLASYPFDVVIK